MPSSDNAIRLSAVLAIVVGAIYAQGLYLGLEAGAWQSGAWRLLALGALIPLVPGVLALAGRFTFLLPLVWGWVLGVHLPKMMTPNPALPPELVTRVQQRGGHISAITPDRGSLIIVGLAIAGIALYLFGFYRQISSRI
jgi:hypothetical protein